MKLIYCATFPSRSGLTNDYVYMFDLRADQHNEPCTDYFIRYCPNKAVVQSLVISDEKLTGDIYFVCADHFPYKRYPYVAQELNLDNNNYSKENHDI